MYIYNYVLESIDQNNYIKWLWCNYYSLYEYRIIRISQSIIVAPDISNSKKSNVSEPFNGCFGIFLTVFNYFTMKCFQNLSNFSWFLGAFEIEFGREILLQIKENSKRNDPYFWVWILNKIFRGGRKSKLPFS